MCSDDVGGLGSPPIGVMFVIEYGMIRALSLCTLWFSVTRPIWAGGKKIASGLGKGYSAVKLIGINT